GGGGGGGGRSPAASAANGVGVGADGGRDAVLGGGKGRRPPPRAAAAGGSGLGFGFGVARRRSFPSSPFPSSVSSFLAASFAPRDPPRRSRRARLALLATLVVLVVPLAAISARLLGTIVGTSLRRWEGSRRVRRRLEGFPDYEKLADATREFGASVEEARCAVVVVAPSVGGLRGGRGGGTSGGLRGARERDCGVVASALRRYLAYGLESYAALHGCAHVDLSASESEGKSEGRSGATKGARTRARPEEGPKPDGCEGCDAEEALLSLLERRVNLEWALVLDGCSVILQPFVSMEETIEEVRGEFAKRPPSPPPSGPLAAATADGALLIKNDPAGRDVLRARLLGVRSDAAAAAATLTNSSSLRRRIFAAHGGGRGGYGGPRDALSSLEAKGKELLAHPPPTSMFPPLSPPSSESLPPEREEMVEAAKGAIRRAWDGYADACLRSPPSSRSKLLGSHVPCDDLSPLSDAGHDWLYHAATVHDALDTLFLAFGPSSPEYREALDAALGADLQATSLRPTKAFEYSLRVVGGLLGAFSATGDARLLSRARGAADALLRGPFASSPTPLPRPYDVLAPPRGGGLAGTLCRLYARLYERGRDAFTREHRTNSLAGVGSYSLEFYFLSEVLGDDRYRRAADDVFDHVAKRELSDGTVPSGWDVMTGEPTTSWGGGLGSGSDSFAEYLLKVPLFACGRGDGDGKETSAAKEPFCGGSDRPAARKMMELYRTAVDDALRSKDGRHLARVDGEPGTAYPIEGGRYHQLLCFLPGLVALRTTVPGVSEAERKEGIALAEEMLQGCASMYRRSPSGLGPEEVRVVREGAAVMPPPGDRRYLLRPEYVESLFVLYRVTKDERYRNMGWEFFRSLEEHCRTERGYAGLNDVYDPAGGRLVDNMPSYFLAETLKYSLLLFGPDEYVSLDDFVFTTEAHPMRRARRVGHGGVEVASRYILAELSDSRYEVRVPFPWPVFGAVVLVAGALAAVLRACCKGLSASSRALRRRPR
ncbi:hypothetical protein ACHAWF_007668, partial [Thalassiosira exigua]